jgi:hypothetical protein
MRTALNAVCRMQPTLQLGTLAEGATKTREIHMSKQFQFVKLYSDATSICKSVQ